MLQEDTRASDLFAALYHELRRLARSEIRRVRAGDILGTRTLVHEAWLNIGPRASLAFDEHDRFMAYAARAMRGLVIDHVRAHVAQKRGGGVVPEPLDEELCGEAALPGLHAIDEALEQLAALEPQLAHVVSLKFFGGFTLSEVARMQGLSERTVQRQWQKARLLLHRLLRPA